MFRPHRAPARRQVQLCGRFAGAEIAHEHPLAHHVHALRRHPFVVKPEAAHPAGNRSIGDDVHVGSNCVLVAPVTLGNGATIGGGSTITKDVNPGDLAVARGKQVALTGWTRPTKKR